MIYSNGDGEYNVGRHHGIIMYMFFLNYALRAGGGIGDVVEPPSTDDLTPYLQRFFFDILFFIFIIIIWMNIIFGTIIDTFAELRDK